WTSYLATMMWVLVAVSASTLLSSTNGAALPKPTPEATTLVHAGHHADVVFTDQGFHLNRVNQQNHDEIAPVLIQYNADIPSEDDQRVRRQLQQESNAIGQPSVQFFTDVGSFNQEIQRLFGGIQGQAPVDPSTAKVAVPGAAATPASPATTSAGSQASNTPATLNSNVGGVSLDEANEQVGLRRPNNNNPGNSQAILAGQINSNVGVSALSGQVNSNVGVPTFPGQVNSNVGVPFLPGQVNSNVGVPIFLSIPPTGNQGNINEGILNTINQQTEGSLGRLADSIFLSNTMDTSINTLNGGLNTAAADVALNSNTNVETIRSINPEGSVVNSQNTGSLVDQQAANSPKSLNNFRTNFPSRSLDASNIITNFGNAFTSPAAGSQFSDQNVPIILLSPSDIQSLFGVEANTVFPNIQANDRIPGTYVTTQQNNNIANDNTGIFNNQVNDKITGTDVTTQQNNNIANDNTGIVSNQVKAITQQNNNIANANAGFFSNQANNRIPSTDVTTQQNSNTANEGVASAGIRRLKERIRNPTNQSPREIFLEELEKSGIASPLQLSLGNSDPNNFNPQSFANIGGGSQVNNVQNQASVSQQEQSTIIGQTQVPRLESPQNLLTGKNTVLGGIPNKSGANQQFIAIPIHIPNALPNGNQNSVPNVDNSNQNGFTPQTFANIGVRNPQRHTEQGSTGPNSSFRTQNQPRLPLSQSHRFSNQGQLHNTNAGVPQRNFNQINQGGNAAFATGNTAVISGHVPSPFRQPTPNNQQGFSGLNSQVNPQPAVHINQFQSRNYNQVIPASTSNLQELSRLIQRHNIQSSLTPVIGSQNLLLTPKGPPQVGFFSNRFCNPPHKCRVVSEFGTFHPITV
ncbi:unnamed protein product, partial [Meganyctiphanes norvegica]